MEDQTDSQSRKKPRQTSVPAASSSETLEEAAAPVKEEEAGVAQGSAAICRIAVVIGNSDYTPPALAVHPCGVADARAMVDVLRSKQYRILNSDHTCNLTSTIIRTACLALGAEMLQEASQVHAILYFSGNCGTRSEHAGEFQIVMPGMYGVDAGLVILDVCAKGAEFCRVLISA